MASSFRNIGFATVLAVLIGPPGIRSEPQAAVPHGNLKPAGAGEGFERNHGQFDPAVRFASRGRGYTLFLTDTEAVLSLGSSVIRLVLEQATPTRPTGLMRLPGVVNYLRGNDPANWLTGIPRFGRVQVDEVYPGIDLVYYSNDGNHEYDFVVAPGADASRIALRVDGSDRMTVDERTGNLEITTPTGALTMRAPSVYQTVGGARRLVDARYLLQDDRLGFALGTYDRAAPLVIDPELVYGSFLGGAGNGQDKANGVDVDADGSAYVVGTTEATDFPTLKPIQGQRRGASDAFVTKLTRDGQLVYSTYLGGTSFDYGDSIAVRTGGIAYVGGTTTSNDFPVRDAFQRDYRGNNDAFVVELSADGTAVTKGTYLGGGGNEGPRGVVLSRVDDSPSPDNVFGDYLFVYGSTTSSDFPTERPAQANRAGDQDGFVTVLDRQTFRPRFSTYAGQPGQNTAAQLMLNHERGDVYLYLRRGDDNGPLIAHMKPSASTPSPSSIKLVSRVSPSAEPFDSSAMVFEAVMGEVDQWTRDLERRRNFRQQKADLQNAILNCKDPKERKSLESILHNCYGDANRPDRVRTAAIPQAVLQNAVFALATPLCLPVPPSTTCTDRGSLVYFDADVKSIGFVNFGGQRAGQTSDFTPVRAVVDDRGQIHILGETTDRALGVVSPVQAANRGSTEGFIMTLDPATGDPSFVSYLGGSTFDTPVDIAVDSDGNRWIVGQTLSADFPITRSGLQPEMKGRTDAFVVKITR